ncbi:MFS transporter [Litoreibacter roseus]|nr:MFS transporter [Litoreibacter roseus]
MTPVTGDTARPDIWPRIGMVAVASFGCVMAILSGQISGFAQADLAGGLGVSADAASWFSTLYQIGQIIVIPLVAISTLALSARTVAMSAGVGFAFTSALAVSAVTYEQMLLLRLLQGFFGGAFPVLTMLLVMRSFPPGEGQREGLAVFAMAVSVSLGCAALAADFLTFHLSHDGPFVFQVGWTVFYIFLVAMAFPRQQSNLVILRMADWRSYFLLVVGFCCLVIALTQGERLFWFESATVMFSTLFGIGFLGATLVSLTRAERPFIDLSLIGRITFGWAMLMALTVRFALLVVAFVVPQYLIRLQGFRAGEIAEVTLWLVPVHLLAFPAAYFAVRLLDPRLTLMIGLLLFAAAAAINVDLNPLWAAEQFRTSMVFLGTGQAFFMVSLLAFAVHGLRPENGATAGTLFNMTRILGQALGTAMIATLVTEREKFHSNQIVEHLTASDGIFQNRLAALANGYASVGLPEPQLSGLNALRGQIANQAYVLAYMDAFVVLAVLLSAAAFLVWMLPDIRPRPKSQSELLENPNG